MTISTRPQHVVRFCRFLALTVLLVSGGGCGAKRQPAATSEPVARLRAGESDVLTVTKIVTQTQDGTITRSFSSTYTYEGTDVTTFTHVVTATKTETGTDTETAYGTVTTTGLETQTTTQTSTAYGSVTSTALGTGTLAKTVTVTSTATLTNAGTYPITGTVAGTWTVTGWSTGAWTGARTKVQATTNFYPTQSPTVFVGTVTKTATDTSGYNPNVTKTATGTVTQFGNKAGTVTMTMSDTATGTIHYVGSGTTTVTGTGSNTGAARADWTYCPTSTLAETGYQTVTVLNTVTNSNTFTTLFTATYSNTVTNTKTVTNSSTLTLAGVDTNSSTAIKTGTETSTSSESGTVTVTRTATGTATSTNTVAIVVPFAKGLGFADVAVGANGAMAMADRAKAFLSDGATPGPMSNAGDGTTDIGVDALVGTLASVGAVSLRERAQVIGDLMTGGLVSRQNHTTVTGTITENATLTPTSMEGWSTVFPATNQGDAILEPDSTGTIQPGAYGQVIAYSRANLTLVSGTYHVASFDIEPEAFLTLDKRNGPIIVYVTGAVVFRGTMMSGGGDASHFLLAALGSEPIYIERAFTGTIVAPNADLTLGALVPLTMRGGFYTGRNLTVRPDTSLIAGDFPWIVVNPPDSASCHSPDDTDHDGVRDCEDQCPYDPNKKEPGVCDCGTSDVNSDGDLLPDCLDECPDDPDKTAIGQCGCKGKPGLVPEGTACADTPCPELNAVCDGNGTCGTGSSQCDPSGGNGCQLIVWRRTAYWFCGVWSAEGRAARSNADQACRAKGMSLLRIDSETENRYIQRLLKGPVWMGANDLGAAGTWRWSSSTSNDGEPFWSGGSNGATVSSRYANWTDNAPGANRCAVMNENDGRWIDASCSGILGYVCEHHMGWPKKGPFKPPVPESGGPMGNDCVPEGDPSKPQLPYLAGDPPWSDEAIAAAQNQLNEEMALEAAGTNVGSAASPPQQGAACEETDPASTAIGSEPGAGCLVLDKQDPDPDGNGCMEDADCKIYGGGTSSYVCREVRATPDCTPSGISPSNCKEHAYCVLLDCSALAPTPGLPCDEVNICNPGSEKDAGMDPNSPIDAMSFNPTTMFGGQEPPKGEPSAEYVDEAPQGTPVGVAHPWCKFGTQNPEKVLPANQATPLPAAETKKSSIISLAFHPDLQFNINPKALALGESNMTLEASASIVASVALNNFMTRSYSADILKAVASVKGTRCTFRTTDTALQILGQNVNLAALGVPVIDTSDPKLNKTLAEMTRQCDDAVASYQIVAGRVKKAFRDAQQLLKQFHTLKSLGKTMDKTKICEILATMADADLDVSGFPQGARCYDNEPIEALINRFVAYYQAPGLGQVTKLKNVTGSLKTVSDKLKQKILDALGLGTSEDIRFKFLDKAHQESQTIVNVPFAIGPIPCVLQVDFASRYGITGDFGLALKFPSNLTDTNVPGKRQTIAHIGASVVPYAAAKLSAFAGAGWAGGPFSATLGLEGAINLATVRAPAFIGAGLDMQVLSDTRVLPPDVQSVSIVTKELKDAFQFGIPKSFKFSAFYDYGLRVDAEDILAGEINARLRIRFCFFSRTWRKRVIKFNGFNFHYDLLAGGGSLGITLGDNPAPPTGTKSKDGTDSSDELQTKVGEGHTTMGLSESEVPLTILTTLPQPRPSDAPPGTPVSEPVRLDELESLFYDNLCCAKPGDACEQNGTPYPPCCSDVKCVQGVCGQPLCRKEGQNCKSREDCCPPSQNNGKELTCGGLKTCTICSRGPYYDGLRCDGNDDCCSGYYCNLTKRECETGGIIY